MNMSDFCRTVYGQILFMLYETWYFLSAQHTPGEKQQRGTQVIRNTDRSQALGLLITNHIPRLRTSIFTRRNEKCVGCPAAEVYGQLFSI
jgi:hypothetical protein